MNIVQICENKLALINSPEELDFLGHGHLPGIQFDSKCTHLFVTNPNVSRRLARSLCRVTTLTHIYLCHTTLVEFVLLVGCKKYVHVTSITPLHMENIDFFMSSLAEATCLFRVEFPILGNETLYVFNQAIVNFPHLKCTKITDRILFLSNHTLKIIDHNILYNHDSLLILNESLPVYSPLPFPTLPMQLFDDTYDHILLPHTNIFMLPKCNKLTLSWAEGSIPSFIFHAYYREGLNIYAHEHAYVNFDPNLLDPHTGKLRFYGMRDWSNRLAIVALICLMNRGHNFLSRLLPIIKLIQPFLIE